MAEGLRHFSIFTAVKLLRAKCWLAWGLLTQLLEIKEKAGVMAMVKPCALPTAFQPQASLHKLPTAFHLKNYELTPMNLNTPPLGGFCLIHSKAVEI